MKLHIYIDKKVEEEIKAFKKSGGIIKASSIFQDAILKYIRERKTSNIPENVKTNTKKAIEELRLYLDHLEEMEKASVGEEKIITKNEIKDPDIKELSI